MLESELIDICLFFSGNFSTVLLIAEEDQVYKHLLKNYTIQETTATVGGGLWGIYTMFSNLAR